MRRWWLILLILAGSFGLFVAMVLSRPIALIKVVDEGGAPIEGAVVKPDGLRPVRNGGHYGWDPEKYGTNSPVKTDSFGVARIRYPQYVIEELPVDEISFGVDHPDYCHERPFRKIMAGPPANAPLKDRLEFYLGVIMGRSSIPPVVMRRGMTVTVAGYIGSVTNRVGRIRPDIGGRLNVRTDDWREIGPGVLMTRTVSPGTNMLRLVHLAEDGQLFFSDIIKFAGKKEESHRFNLELKPALRVLGKLDELVTRPIRNGFVHAYVADGSRPMDAHFLFWRTWTEVNPDGTFEFALPPGQLELIALCEGYTSQGRIENGTRSSRKPQVFSMNAKETQVTIAMEHAAAIEVQVMDEKGSPILDAKVAVNPNVTWGNYSSTIFGMAGPRPEDALKPGAEKSKLRYRSMRYNSATDSSGMAIISNIPPQAVYLLIEHDNFEMLLQTNFNSMSRDMRLELSAGEIMRSTVTVQPKGTQVMRE